MMLVQTVVPHPPPPELHFNAHISSPSAVQIRERPARASSSSSSSTAAAAAAATALPSFTIRAATIKDAPAIAHLGATVFSTTFGFSIPTPDLKAYLDEAYSVAAIEADIHSPSTQIIVACAPPSSQHNTDERVIGFAQLTEGTSEPCIADLDDLIELQRLYVSSDFHGSGVGRALTARIEAIARTKGSRVLWLGVWEGNFRAQRVYEAMGFARVGDHEFKMGKCIQTDWIMCKDL